MSDFNSDFPVKIYDSEDPTLGTQVDSERNIHNLPHTKSPDNEAKPLKSLANQDLKVADVIDRSDAVYGAITVGTLPVEIKVGALPIESRKSVILLNNSNKNMYWGLNDQVTTATGMIIYPRQSVTWQFTENTKVWIVSDTDGLDARISEL